MKFFFYRGLVIFICIGLFVLKKKLFGIWVGCDRKKKKGKEVKEYFIFLDSGEAGFSFFLLRDGVVYILDC